MVTEDKKKIFKKIKGGTKMKTKSLTTFTIDKQTYSVRTTEHSEKRLVKREIDEYTVVSNILSLGKEKIKYYQEQDKDVMVIDEIKDFSICFTINKNTIIIITVIDKSDIWVKKNTLVERI
jgi:hypothetical protein